MKICQVTPGLIPIPPNGWGAVEKIIWEYKINLESQGHICDIKYLDEVKKEDYDIVHIHVANLALLAHERGIPYVFTMHDHHSEVYGPMSDLYIQNRSAMEKSVVSFVPAQHLVKYFDTGKVHYLPHGVNVDYFKYIQSSSTSTDVKLLCVGNNGLAGDVSFDRKGFIYAIEAARVLNLPITIAGPSNNKKFFETNKDYVPYDKATFVYDLSEDDLLKLYIDQSSCKSLFLHPSSIEAGHPNLTLLEAMACGFPVLCTYDSDPLPGMVKIDRSVDTIVSAINESINNFDSLRQMALDTAEKNSWSNVVKTMTAGYYSQVDDFRMKNELMNIYDLTTSTNKNIQRPLFNINFVEGAYLSISGGEKDASYRFNFLNAETGEDHFSGNFKTGHWSKCSIQRYLPYNIKVSNGSELLFDYTLDLKNKEVLIVLDSTSLGDVIAWFPYVEEFRKKHKCNVTCSTNWNELFQENYPDVKFQPLSWSGNFFAVYKLGCYNDKTMSLYNYQNASLQRLGSSILGLPNQEIKPNIVVRDSTRKIPHKYVCFATESTAQAKYWNNPTGWQETIDYLNNIGLEPVLIQLGENNSFKNIRNLSGKKTIHDTISYLTHCEFFIGIGSGLSWLAWSLNKPTVLISGFSAPQSEFYTPYRVINSNVCNSCWNEHPFDKGDWNWCPRLKGTDRQFECSKSISSKMVTDKIDQIVGK
jgi:autotransporter strand-loop-strand O-heptosyltransferase